MVGTGIAPDSLKMRALLEKRYNPAKPLLFGKSGYYLAKDMLSGKTMAKHFFHIQEHVPIMDGLP